MISVSSKIITSSAVTTITTVNSLQSIYGNRVDHRVA